MKKNILLILGLLAVCCLGCISCSDDETYDFPGDNVSRIYLKPLDNTVNGFDKTPFDVLKTPVGLFYTADLKFPVYSTLAVTSDVYVSLSVDNSLLESYNQEYGTSYKELPAGTFVLKNSELKISVNNMSSESMVEIDVDKGMLSGMSAGEYLLPLKIEKVTGNAQVSTNRNATYIIVSVSEDTDNIWDTDGGKSQLGNLLGGDRTNWGITTTNSSFDEDTSVLFDGDSSDDVRYRVNSYDDNTGYTVDMQQVYDNISGIYQEFYNSWYTVQSMDIYTSLDNESWTYQGHFDNGSARAEICFYSPIKARYIKTVVRRASPYGVYMCEFNICVK